MLLFLLVLPVASANAQSRQPMPHLTVRDIRGKKIHLRNYQGKVVLINFWATWCPPCRAEIPDLVKLQHEFRSRGLRVIGITYPPQEISEVRQFARSLGVNYPVVLGTKETKLLFTSSEELPITIVVGKDGVVRDIIEGILLPAEIDQLIKPLLNETYQTRRK
jgi:thiol-disulfide isomerase/thioredoxin